jgi:gluconokinase
MAEPETDPLHVVVMGVSGVGKTTVATGIADALGWVFAEGDGFHPAANVAKMSAGVALDDADREPWLRELAEWTARHHRDGVRTVITCSALKRKYRDILRDGLPDEAVFFVCLSSDPDTLRARMSSRLHYMPPSLLDSQLAAFEPLGADENGVTLDTDRPPDEVVAAAVNAVRGRLGS